MSDAGFVVAGWAITAVVLIGYWVSVVARVRRAERVAPPDGRGPDGGPTP